ncbi:DUF3618 domain-containing protein [Streptomyces sp. MNP-20]|uniref:DUF3618 domain-containing protein n=1 Tax=Streptomyces sp. MNP-20 TaxID=2721165 RepID=UPI001557EEDA|nr:DUF3618 domain-containing protein [Streptomyces sp. MNP-20]
MTRLPHEDESAESPRELRDQVEQTRHELAGTVAALAAKADVRARAQEKATEVKEQTVAKAGELKEQAVVKARELKDKAADAATRAQDKLPDLPAPVRDKAVQARAQAARTGRVWEEKAPEPLRARTAQGARAARNNRAVLLAAGGAAALVWLAYRRRNG